MSANINELILTPREYVNSEFNIANMTVGRVAYLIRKRKIKDIEGLFVMNIGKPFLIKVDQFNDWIINSNNRV